VLFLSDEVILEVRESIALIGESAAGSAVAELARGSHAGFRVTHLMLWIRL